jgi:hypothetical protein
MSHYNSTELVGLSGSIVSGLIAIAAGVATIVTRGEIYYTILLFLISLSLACLFLVLTNVEYSFDPLQGKKSIASIAGYIVGLTAIGYAYYIAKHE